MVRYRDRWLRNSFIVALMMKGSGMIRTQASPSLTAGFQFWISPPQGKQPMHSRCGRYTIAYNGEIYNHLELRTGLETQGHVCNWRGSSDTETLLAAFSIWG